MKNLLILIFMTIGISAYAQKAESTQPEKVAIEFTDLQKEKIKAIEDAKKNLDAQLNEIIVFILDSKGIKAEEVEGLEPKEGGIIVTKKKK